MATDSLPHVPDSGQNITAAEIHAAAQDPIKTLQLIKRICGGTVDVPAVYRALAMADMQAVADEAWNSWEA